MNAEQLLTDTFARHEHLAPEAAAVLGAIQDRLDGRSHHHRSTVVAAFSAAVAVAAVAFGTTALVGNAAGTRQSDRPAASYVTTADDRVSQFGVPVGGRFVDRDHGFVVLMRCPYSVFTPPAPHDPRLEKPCRDVLAATSDAGTTYHEHALPITPGADFDMYVFDATHLAIVQQSEVVAIGTHDVSVRADRWISDNGGVTWSAVDLQAGDAFAEIPPGAQLIRVGHNGDRPAVLTPDGVLHPLTQSSVATSDVEVPLGTVTAAGGMYFLYTYADPRDPASTADLWISHDHGRTWQRAHPPSGNTAPRVLGFDGHWLYALAQTGSADWTCSPGLPTSCQVSASPTIVIASNDVGRTWQKMQLPSHHPSSYTWVGVAPAGGLVYDDGAQLWRASGAGRFVRMTAAAKTQYLLGLGPAMVAIRVARDGTISLATSTDGAHWRNATIG